MVETDFRIGVQSAATTSAGPQILSMVLGRRTTQWALIPERSADLITVVQPEASLLPDTPAWVEGSTVEAGSTAAEDMVAEATGRSVIVQSKIEQNKEKSEMDL